MALEKTFLDLHLRLDRLHDELVSVHLTSAEDQPVDPPLLAERLADSVADSLGWLEEAQAAAAEAQLAVRERPDLDRARRALAHCQDCYGRLAQHYTGKLVSYHQVAALLRLGRERGGEWRAWARSVKLGLERCHDPLYEGQAALIACWQEMAERAGTPAA